MFDEIRRTAARVASDIAKGPVIPTVSPPVTPEEIRDYLTSRYDFTKPMA